MKPCDQDILLSAYHDGELDAERRGRFEQHLRDCPTCAAELEAYRAISRSFADAEPAHLSPDARGRIVDAMLDQADESRTVRWARRLTAVAAAVFLFCMGHLFLAHRAATSGGEGVREAWSSQHVTQPERQTRFIDWLLNGVSEKGPSDGNKR